MNKHIYKYISLSVLLSGVFVHADDPAKDVLPKFTIRSQASNTPRRVAHTIGHTKIHEMDENYHTLSITTEYTRSFDATEIAQCLFGDSLCGNRHLKIQGSRISGRDENALLADYFYLPTDFNSLVTIRPQIQNFIVDMNIYCGLDDWVEGLYAWVQAPVVWTKWDLKYSEKVISPGSNPHDEGYFTVNSLQRSSLLDNFTEFMQGRAPHDGTNMINGILVETANKRDIPTQFVTKFNALECARICPRSKTKTQLAELRAAIGYNFLLNEDYHLGLNIQVTAPTGNDTKPDFLFNPQNGNDDHWELGAGLSAHFVFWRSDDEERHFSFNLDANVTHMFKNRQRRCFDVCGKPLSRYMLTERLGEPVIDGLIGSDISQEVNPANQQTPSAQFKAEFTPLANITDFDVDVSVGVNADLAFWFNYISGPWNWDFGYNFWARSCEKIRLDSDCKTFKEDTWAFKGDAWVYGYMTDNEGGSAADRLQQFEPVALSATMSKATINGGDNLGKKGVDSTDLTAIGTPFDIARRNPNIDKPQFAYAGDADKTRLDIDRTFDRHQRTSIDPIFIKQKDINFARVKGISHKVFSHLGYTWEDKDKWIPYIGLGIEVEWATTDGDSCDEDDCGVVCNTDCDTDCDSDSTSGDCIKCGVTQWGVWAKFGVSFR